ncbi:hypothetical protein P280DRAFT_524132 [Massarina eburnea CBS 473.64]|uniref:Uncharacterized protein n=1 Tax=Massarina eburnea CBS 473.64 TaxID=1395130 RepID=A0A6A6RK92_9PLEO|nr:hypothetical protein P280DRAFT_524132 [Massarina eburnea CBS 473.64]
MDDPPSTTAGAAVATVVAPTITQPTLLDVLDVFWHIFSNVMKYEYKPVILGITQSTYKPVHDITTVPYYTITIDRETAMTMATFEMNESYDTIIGDFGEDRSYELIAAFAKWAQCDFSMVCMYEPIVQKLLEINAKADWIVIHHPKYRFLLGMHDTEPAELTHSVMLVSTDEESYIADFTVEQHGWDSSNFLTPVNEYLENFTYDRRWSHAPSFVTDSRNDPSGRVLTNFVREFSDGFDWSELVGMDNHQLGYHVSARVREAIESYQVPPIVRNLSPTHDAEDGEDNRQDGNLNDTAMPDA